MRLRCLLVLGLAPLLLLPSRGAAQETPTLADYFDRAGRDDARSGGVRLIPIATPHGDFRVWTKRVGTNPAIKVLLLHGGPGMTHELYEVFDSYFPGAGIEYYVYDQLGSHYSDQPDDDRLWTTARFVDEVEQVRQALGLTGNDFYLYGQSWGGLLAMEYALAYPQHLKGLVISNMMASIPAYNTYAADVLAPQLPPDVLADVRALEAAEDFSNPRYEALLMEHYYPKHVLRGPVDRWPDPVLRALAHVNPSVYVLMQGPSEFGVRGRLETWDRTADLAQIDVPTLVIGAEHDTMDPVHMEWMAGELPRGRYLHIPGGAHLAQYDDPERYFEGLIRFLKDVDAGTF